MSSQKFVSSLESGNVFRDWPVHKFKDMIDSDRCKVHAFKIPASHTVCRYELKGEDFGVAPNFYPQLTGCNRNCNAKPAVHGEFDKLKRD